MKVTVDVSPAVHHRAGMGRYAAELVEAMRREAGAMEGLQLFYTEAGTARPEGVLASLPRFTTTLRYKPWRLAAMASLFARIPFDRFYGRPDILHATDHLLPYLRAASVFTLHDLIFEIFPEHHKRYNYLFLKLMMPRFLRAADRVICVSEHTRRDATRLYRIPGEKMVVIYEAADPRFQVPVPAEALEAARARYGLPDEFVLHVGTLEPRKNLGALLDAFGRLKADFPALKLVLAGGKGWLYEPFFEKLRHSGLADEVVLPGYVADEDLPALYRLATVFAFPSVYEGFGLPPLEALACGTPVVCSAASSLPEVVGEAALLFPPDDVGALIAALRRMLSDSTVRERMGRLGPAQASRFSWQRAARETRAVYEELFGVRRAQKASVT